MEQKKVIYHILFWIFIFAFVFDYFYDFVSLEDSLIYTGTECILYIGVAYFNLLVIIPTFYRKNEVWKYIGILCLFLGVSLVAYNLLGLEELLMGVVSVKSKVSFSLNFMLYIILSFLYWYYERFQKEQQKALVLQNEKLNTEMALLKAQISPHFLFNSLNNIYSLSLAKSDDAPVMVEKLSDILRYLIYEGKKEQVSLKAEIELIQKYLDIHKLKRVKGAANISFETEGVKEGHQIVPLILINFIENGFKHGDVQYDTNGYLNIKINVDSTNKMTLLVENSKQPKAENSGIGIQNVKQQLELHYPNKHQLSIENQETVFNVNLTLNV
jgi:LytS/YehU family sensor histidine kinase